MNIHEAVKAVREGKEVVLREATLGDVRIAINSNDHPYLVSDQNVPDSHVTTILMSDKWEIE